MGAISARLPKDCFDLSDRFKKALDSVEACRQLMFQTPLSPLLARVDFDFDKTLLVGYLLTLIGVKW
ncbi:hypothetical protein ACP70R_003503 [Stipagrostis hirtigluma subsp. patula]